MSLLELELSIARFPVIPLTDDVLTTPLSLPRELFGVVDMSASASVACPCLP